MSTFPEQRMIISEEVKNAFSNRQGIVCLESTVITHGLPYPDNLKLAQDLEDIIRNEGAVPASIAVLDGIIRVGLTSDELVRLATEPDMMKISRRDMPYVLSQKVSGGTTVAATMLIADKAKIKVFATGGIGGVHRQAEETFDISADLEELAISDVCVVCAGAKAILDIAKTLEVLETKGVPVITYQNDIFPAFYYRDSALKSPLRLDHVKEISALLVHKWNLKNWMDGFYFKGGVLIANPIPQESEMDKETIENLIAQAIIEMNIKGIKGKETTPYLLARISELSNEESKQSNLDLLKDNAKLAAQIAKELVHR